MEPNLHVLSGSLPLVLSHIQLHPRHERNGVYPVYLSPWTVYLLRQIPIRLAPLLLLEIQIYLDVILVSLVCARLSVINVI
jgi:hypothetical protein